MSLSLGYVLLWTIRLVTCSLLASDRAVNAGRRRRYRCCCYCSLPPLHLPLQSLLPVPRAAILFHSMTPAGAFEKRSMHGSCPVIKGECER